MKASQVLIASIAAVALSACSKSKSPSAPARDRGVAKVEDMTGVWKTVCTATAGGFEVRSLSVTNDRIVNSSEIFQDAACASTTGMSITTLEGPYKVTGPSASLAGAVDLEVQFTDMSGTKRTGYTLYLRKGDTVYLAGYLGLNTQSRPTAVDKKFAYKKVTLTPSPTPSPAPDLDIAGVWKSKCAVDPHSPSFYSIETHVITEQTIETSLELFSDAACSQSQFSTNVSSGTYDVEGPSQVLDGAFDIHLSLRTSGGQAFEGYNIVLFENGSLFLGGYLGGDPANRPHDVDRDREYLKH